MQGYHFSRPVPSDHIEKLLLDEVNFLPRNVDEFSAPEKKPCGISALLQEK